ncbi:hypothetical protein [Roseateles sp. DXS20W]|uniref:hypothetical protein n=1 Tax=Pelomonas lactea TaxID=3299030 RepID=UPI003749EEDD
MPPSRPLPAHACLSLLALALTACGGGGGGGTPAGSAPLATAPVVTTPATPAPAPTPTPTPSPTPATPEPPLTVPATPASGVPSDAATPPVSTVTCTSGDVLLAAPAVLALVNLARVSAGVPQFERLPALEGTAQAHARYVAFNEAGGTDEVAGQPCFSGSTVDQRLAAAGVSPVLQGGVRAHGESVLGFDTIAGQSYFPATELVEHALDNLYGRMLLLNPVAQHVGIGASLQSRRGVLVLDTARIAASTPAAADGFAVWPRDTSSGVPVRMPASSMKPLEAGLSEGYPITLHAMSVVQVSRFVITRASDGTPVAATVITSASDRNRFIADNEAGLVPNAPLAAGTQYRVELDATIGSTAVHRTWMFTTAP